MCIRYSGRHEAEGSGAELYKVGDGAAMARRVAAVPVASPRSRAGGGSRAGVDVGWGASAASLIHISEPTRPE